MEFGEELKTFIQVWFIAILATCYCYLISIQIISKFPRLLSVLPVIIIFFIVPIPLSTIHFTLITFLYLTWLANFKLLLYAFNRGPLASTPPLPFFKFISITLFPINYKETLERISVPVLVPAITSAPAPAQVSSHKSILLTFKVLILTSIVVSYQYKNSINRKVILGFYYCHIYLCLELAYAITALFVKIFTGFKFEIEPQFNEPYLATSLQDFWGRRWNLVVSSILRPIVYNPIREVTIPVIGKQWSQMSAIFVTFMVSGLMHELMYLYLTHARPTWEVTLFFALHGVCTATEVAIKKTFNGRFRLHGTVSGPLTMVFVVVTGLWLLLPQILRNGVDVKIINECLIIVEFLKPVME